MKKEGISGKNHLEKIGDESKKVNEQGGLRQAIMAFSVLGGVGFFFVVVLGICLYVGIKADEFFLLGGKGKVFGIVLGFPIAFFLLWKQLKNHDIL